MDIYWCLKAITQLSKIYGASPVNNKIIFFGGHNSHFGDRANIHMEHQNIQPLFLKAGNYINVHLNDNGPNSKLKCCYNELKPVLILKYGMTNLLPCRMKSIFVESWYVFNISAGNIIRYIFSKKKLPLIPRNLTINTQAFDAYIQVYSGSNSGGINEILRLTVASIEVQYIRTDYLIIVLP